MAEGKCGGPVLTSGWRRTTASFQARPTGRMAVPVFYGFYLLLFPDETEIFR
jgi:hypothetical protein